jgi:hypothetical protein
MPCYHLDREDQDLPDDQDDRLDRVILSITSNFSSPV